MQKWQQEVSTVEYLSEECIVIFLKHPSPHHKPFTSTGWEFSGTHDWPVVFSFQGHLTETPVSLEMLLDTWGTEWHSFNAASAVSKRGNKNRQRAPRLHPWACEPPSASIWRTYLCPSAGLGLLIYQKRGLTHQRLTLHHTHAAWKFPVKLSRTVFKESKKQKGQSFRPVKEKFN